MAEWTQPLMDRHRRVLNRLEPHLGCVTCKSPLIDGGICPDCDPCSCGGVRWVDDEGWEPVVHGETRREGDGLVPCGFCGDWDIDPMPPYEERDNGHAETPEIAPQNGSQEAPK